MDSIRNTKGEYLNITHTNSTNTTNTDKTNSHDSQSKDTKTEESYSDFMNNMEYYSVLGFLLSRMAYELAHEKQMSD